MSAVTHPQDRDSVFIDSCFGLPLPELPEGLRWGRSIVELPGPEFTVHRHFRVKILRDTGNKLVEYTRPRGGVHQRSWPLRKLRLLSASQRADLVYQMGVTLLEEYRTELARFGPRPSRWRRFVQSFRPEKNVTIVCDEPDCGTWQVLGRAQTADAAREALRGTGWMLDVAVPDRAPADFCPTHAKHHTRPEDCDRRCRHRCPACRMGLVTHLRCDPKCELNRSSSLTAN